MSNCSGQDMHIMDNDDMKIDELSSLGELADVDEILANAAAATDAGDYHKALNGFEQALNVTKRIFGDNIELSELKLKIADIHKLLDAQNPE